MRTVLLVWLALLAAPLQAAESPSPGHLDPHIQAVRYDPDEVVRLKGRFGFQTMIEFDVTEYIENVAIGDSLGWQVTPNKRANKLFVKPVDRRATTNLTVVTDRRTYNFALSVAPKGSVTPWVLRFRYPAPALAYVEPVVKPVIDPATLNHAYTMAGARDLLPSEVYDDGRQTWFAFPGNVSSPAIFAVAADGRETLVNYVIKGGLTVVQQTAGRFVLRSGKAMATVTSTPGSGPVRLPAKEGKTR